ncbi:MAG: amidinotransferase [Cytophagaceae bacterium]|nr:amidinotransferase [Cytophagaceae bacterium]
METTTKILSGPIHVSSETGKLIKLLVHRPDEGIEKVTPSRAVDLLYEDIVYLPKMREEHDIFTQAISLFIGNENLYDVQNLLKEILANADVKEELIKIISRLEDLSSDISKNLNRYDNDTLARIFISGSEGDKTIFNPLPNFIFTRDIGVIINDHLLTGLAFKDARNRESLLSSFIFNHHPLFSDLAKEKKIIDFSDKGRNLLYKDDDRVSDISVEGGDIMLVNKDHLLIATSERTSSKAVTKVIHELFEKNVVSRISHVDLPKNRYCMHLDTVFTFISSGESVCFEPLIIKEDKMPVQHYTKAGKREKFPSIKSLLKNENPKMDFIPCGEGISPFDEREQWTDGCNLVAVKDGVCFTYDRNIKTNKALKNHGYNILKATDLLEEASSGKFYAETLKRTIITIPSSELSRARGGPHCMTMPLVRE